MSKGSPHSWYLSMSARYGDIASVRLGSNLVVCISSTKILRELFNRFESTGRPQTPLNALMGGLGIVLSEDILWKRQRYFLHDKFRALGVNLWKNQRLEKIIMAEIEELLRNLEKRAEEPVDPVMVLGRHLHNVICQLMMSFRFEEGNEEFVIFNERLSRSMNLYGSIHIGEHLPCYLKLPGKKTVLKEIRRSLQDISQFHAKHIEKRLKKRADLSGKEEQNDLLDYYLEQMQNEETGAAQAIFNNVDPVKQIVQVMNDLFSAGMETSRTTIVWLLLMMLREPKVAQKVMDDLSNVVEVGKIVTMEHRSKLPYVEAVIYETLRRVSVVPLGTTHVNTKEWEINGYSIPAGTHIVPLINKINMDPKYFYEPEKFLPERFLKNGVLCIPECFIPFGVGRRICLGMHLARIELFLFFTNIMNNYKFTLADGQELPGLEGTFGATHSPRPYTLIFKQLQLK
ncbi:unnamed protein product [Parnassius mnemosyne]|uniref:Cytochrome P450 n=1 Tax=Parnassius mnemosyne TaxID=213953 RepID=A0AAV1KJT4_9NEOP